MAAVVVAALSAPQTARAEATHFTSRAEFQAAFPDLSVESFEGGLVADNQVVTCPSVVDSQSPCFGGAMDQNLILAALPVQTPEILADMLLTGPGAIGNATKLLTTSGPEQFHAFAFIHPETGEGRQDVTAVGFDAVSEVPAGCYFVAQDTAGAVITEGEIPCTPEGTFVGFESEVPIGVVGIYAGPVLVGADDITYNLAAATVDTAIAAHPAVLSTAGPTVTLTLSATLTAVGGGPIEAQPVQFYIGETLVCSGLTDSGGDASCGGFAEAIDATLAGGYTAVFGGGNGYNGSTGTGAIIA